jgi:hypothetical protein
MDRLRRDPRPGHGGLVDPVPAGSQTHDQGIQGQWTWARMDPQKYELKCSVGIKNGGEDPGVACFGPFRKGVSRR